MIRELWNSLFRREEAVKAKAAELRIRQAEPTDLQFIVDLCIEQVKKGHLNSDYLVPGVQVGLKHQISCAIGDLPVPMPGRRDGVGAVVLVTTVDDEQVGFAVLLEDMPGSWNTKVEIFIVAIRDDFQGHGIGRLLVENLLESIQAKIVYARCFQPSVRMKGLLLKLGFVRVKTSSSGIATLERRTKGPQQTASRGAVAGLG